MSDDPILAGLEERFATVAGIESGGLLDYEPAAIELWPTIYSLEDSVKFTQEGQTLVNTYRWRHRLCLPWQDPQQAEREVRRYVKALPLAVAADRHLGGALSRGLAQITEADCGWYTIGGTLCRVIDFYSQVIEKAPAPPAGS